VPASATWRPGRRLPEREREEVVDRRAEAVVEILRSEGLRADARFLDKPQDGSGSPLGVVAISPRDLLGLVDAFRGAKGVLAVDVSLLEPPRGRFSVAALTARSLTGAAPLCRTRLDTFVDTEARKPRG
jgi:hypothetical protein